MKNDEKLCPHNFQVWVAFLMGMVVIVIAIVVFDKVSKGRLGYDTVDIQAQRGSTTVDATITVQPVSLLKSTESAGAWLGIEAKDVTKDMAKQLGLSISGGVLVSVVIQNSPAQKAGLLPGDILYEFDRRDIEDVDALIKLLSKADPGDRVKISFFREGSRKVVYVVLEEAVNTNNTTSSSITQVSGDVISEDERWGVVISELNDALRKTYSIPADQKGVLVMMVVSGSAAAKAGIVKGDVIQQVNKTRVNDITSFFKALRSEDNNVILYVYRQGTALFINMVVAYSSPDQVKGFYMAQEGIGMNRPLYVPGYDQTQSGDPDDKTKSATDTGVSVSNPVLVSDETDDDAPVCKRVQDIDTLI
ncbi:MAG: PDZ domain-containing protein [Desulfobacterales bacterium]|nr:PDZ domain-containing protein [Desulfobacterales bacterium]